MRLGGSGDYNWSGFGGVLGHGGLRSLFHRRDVYFSRHGIGGIDGQDRMGSRVRRHSDRQVEYDRLVRLSVLSVAIAQNKREVYKARHLATIQMSDSSRKKTNQFGIRQVSVSDGFR